MRRDVANRQVRTLGSDKGVTCRQVRTLGRHKGVACRHVDTLGNNRHLSHAKSEPNNTYQLQDASFCDNVYSFFYDG